MVSQNLRRTPLYNAHVAAGARMVHFAGWEMPVQYAGILEEHKAVREKAGLFDVSHMGEIEFRGVGALPALQQLLTNDLSVLGAGQAQYACLTNRQGGILDDVISYCVEPGAHYLVCVNASNASVDFDWMKSQHHAKDVRIENTSNAWAQLALQGPLAEKILTEAFASTGWAGKAKALKFMEFLPGSWASQTIYVARSGYTGEDGFEIFLPGALAEEFWAKLLQSGEAVPVGLGARDTLRLEMKYPLHGNDIDEGTTPLEAGLGFAVKLGKAEEFPGKAVLKEQKEKGVARKLVGFELTAPGIARHGYPIKVAGEPFGQVRSGTRSPTLGKSIGLAYLPVDNSAVGSPFAVEIRGKDVGAQVVKTPFVEPHVKR